MKHTNRFYLYAWMNTNAPHQVNLGKKVSSKETYVSSASSSAFWNAYGRGDLMQYCIFESEEEATVSASEWWALDYGMGVYGKEKFYNYLNNAHKGDQSLVTPEIKQKIVDFYENRLTPEADVEKVSLGKNIINKVESGAYEIVNIPVFELEEYVRKQARSVTRNVDGEDEIVRAYNENPKLVLREITPMTICECADGTRKIVNGHTRLGAAARCKGWNTLPVCIVKEEEFGETKVEIETNILIAGSYANRRSRVYSKENTDEDLVFQIESFIALQGLDISHETARPYIREMLVTEFGDSAGSNNKASGVVTKIFNKFDKDQINISITSNLKTYSDSDLKTYCFKKYESKGIAVIRTTMNNLGHFEGLGYVFHHVSHMDKMPKDLAIVVHARTKQEYATEQKADKIGALKRVIAFYNLPITVDVLPSFDEE